MLVATSYTPNLLRVMADIDTSQIVEQYARDGYQAEDR